MYRTVDDLMRHERLRIAAVERLGSDTARCPCGEDDWRCLRVAHDGADGQRTCICENCFRKQFALNSGKARRKKKQPTLNIGEARCCTICRESDPACFEEQHLAGRKFGPETADYCANCHRKYDPWWGDPKTNENEATELRHEARLLRGIAALLIGRAENIEASLDGEQPD
jgi:hypothetical protein